MQNVSFIGEQSVLLLSLIIPCSRLKHQLLTEVKIQKKNNKKSATFKMQSVFGSAC